MNSRQAVEVEDLAIQDTLSMTVEERLELLAHLIVDKIAQDKENDEPIYKKTMEQSL